MMKKLSYQMRMAIPINTLSLCMMIGREPRGSHEGTVVNMVGHSVPTQDTNVLSSHHEPHPSSKKYWKNPCNELRCCCVSMTAQQTQWTTCRHMRGICTYTPSRTPWGIAHTWFRNLPLIYHRLYQLSAEFQTQFVSNRRRERNTRELMAPKQSESESLRDFLGRCNEETITIPKLQQEVVVLALMSGVKDGDFRSYMGRKSLNTLAIVLGKPNGSSKVKSLTEPQI